MENTREVVLNDLKKRYTDELVGVIEFGSVVQQTARPSSDHDILVVVSDQVKLSRDLYYELDKQVFYIDKRPVSLTLAHLPKSVKEASGFWLDVASYGKILFDKKKSIESFFFLVAEEIKNNVIVRRESHGQSYWKRDVHNA